MSEKIQNVMTAIDCIESRLYDQLDLETVAQAVHYSKYHLHRMFTETVGLTIHDYVQRRRLTEAARRLVFSDQSILEIAIAAGYQSQQSFTDSFKAMYKQPPNRYRAGKEFYPLKLRCVLDENPIDFKEKCRREDIHFAEEEDIPQWIGLVRLVIDGFPHLNEERYLEHLRESIKNKRALIWEGAGTAIGVMAFDEVKGTIDFFGAHPQYPKREIAKAFCETALYGLARGAQISVTTFREGDKADTGYRKMWKGLGFSEAECMVEFGYPTQRLILRKAAWEGGGNA